MRHVKPPIDSQFLLFHGMSEKSVILYEEISLPQADSESVVDSAGTHFVISINLHVRLKRKMLWRWAKRGRVDFRNSFVVGDHGETDEDAGREADIEGEDVDVVCGAPALAISGFGSQGFTFSEIVRLKGLEGQTLSEAVVDTARPPQCEFSNLQKIPLPVSSRISSRPVMEFC